MHQKQIAELLGASFQQIDDLLHDPNRYHSFSIGKKQAGRRYIYAPNEQLKIVQQQLLNLLEQYPIHRQAYGFTKGKDFVSNATLHVGKKFIFTFDLQNFFPSINRNLVKTFFQMQGIVNYTAEILTELICHPDGFLPQGAPTSPVMTNLILYRFDQNMEALAKKYNCLYSRYADDLTFSTNEDQFPAAIAKQISDTYWEVNPSIVDILGIYGLKVNPKKVHMQQPNMKKVVTGVVVNEKLNVNRSYIKQVRAALYNLKMKKAYKQEVCKVLGRPEKHWYWMEREDVRKALRVLRGQIEHIGNVRGKADTYYLQLLKQHSALLAIYRHRKLI